MAALTFVTPTANAPATRRYWFAPPASFASMNQSTPSPLNGGAWRPDPRRKSPVRSRSNSPMNAQLPTASNGAAPPKLAGSMSAATTSPAPTTPNHRTGPHWLLWLLVNVVVVRHIVLRAWSIEDAPVPFTTTAVEHSEHVPANGETSTLTSYESLPCGGGSGGDASPDRPADATGARYESDGDAVAHDLPLATSIMTAALPTAYLNSTDCSDVGPTCVQSHDLILYDPALQPADGLYTPLDGSNVPIFASLARLMYVVSWSGTNADAYLGNLKWMNSAVVKAWPAGAGALPPSPFVTCDTPVVLAFDFPDNYWHAMAAYTAVWHALRRGAIDDRATLAILTPHAVLTPREYLTTPLRAVTRGDVTLLPHLASVGAGGGGRSGSRASVGEGGGDALGDADDEEDRILLPRQRCFAHLAVCAVAGYHHRPPLGMFDFMQAVKDALLGLPRNYDAQSSRLAPPAPPPHLAPYVTSPQGVLRIVFAIRTVGSRRVVNAEELLAACAASPGLQIGGGALVPLSCGTYAFGGAAGGMAADVAEMWQATDVLVAVHGAGLTNMGFLRPGALVVEVRPSTFDPANADRFFRPLAMASGSVKWWGLVLPPALLSPGAMEAARMGNTDKWGRDKDVVVPWPALADAIASGCGKTWGEWAAREGGVATGALTVAPVDGPGVTRKKG